ncbi:hypothetical protein Kisp01_36780 [Kineosporia sp. NBRC 101677]|nr:hypothetical protein Kisp01_36780 [Kineosporia sp. NBRC 101677]
MLLGVTVAPSDPDLLIEQVRFAEQAGLDFVLFEDAGAPLSPIEAAAFAAAHTRSIALVAGAAATHAEPFHLANQFASLDWGTHGRAGWFVSTDRTSQRSQAYSTSVPDPDTAQRESEAVVQTARRLWDSWEDEALIADLDTGRFLDAGKIHYVDVENEFFRIRGPALMPRPVQGQVVVLARHKDQIPDVDVVLVETLEQADRTTSRVFAETSDVNDIRTLDGHVDGVLVRADDPRNVFGENVLRELGRPGVPVAAETLRQKLGLPRPASQNRKER